MHKQHITNIKFLKTYVNRLVNEKNKLDVQIGSLERQLASIRLSSIVRDDEGLSLPALMHGYLLYTVSFVIIF